MANKKADNKTRKTGASVDEFLARVAPERQAECRKLIALMRRASGAKPAMWGDSIVGFGEYTYRYASGREGDWMLTGFSPRKGNYSIYIMAGFERFAGQLARLGKHSTGKSCLYVKTLDDVDLEVLEQIVRESVAHMRGDVG